MNSQNHDQDPSVRSLRHSVAARLAGAAIMFGAAGSGVAVVSSLEHSSSGRVTKPTTLYEPTHIVSEHYHMEASPKPDITHGLLPSVSALHLTPAQISTRQDYPDPKLEKR